MRTFISLTFAFMQMITLAQNTNFTVTDCNNLTQNSFDVLNTGRVLIIASKGLDCSICQNQAPSIQSFSAANADKVAVWAAMNNRYSGSTPNCNDLATWRSTYSWNDVYMFIDGFDVWVGDGFPTYYVIEPETKTIILETNSFNTASSTALAVSDTSAIATGINYNNDLHLNVYVANQKLFITTTLTNTIQNATLNLRDLNGKLILNSIVSLSDNTSTIDISAIYKGLYLLQLKDASQKTLLNKKILVQ